MRDWVRCATNIEGCKTRDERILFLVVGVNDVCHVPDKLWTVGTQLEDLASHAVTAVASEVQDAFVDM